ncbi:MAG: nucleoside/nucleotide kinase family protein [Rubellimicrobium sp.]|nr:nucleoside/nucleotide kinase family protein [Rubellimicrobium sp.]
MSLDLTPGVNAVSERIHALLGGRNRLLVAVAGAPGAGKSTFAAELVRRLNAQKVESVIVPMDGFHLDNAVLDARGLRRRKGAPETFDAAGFVHLVRRLTAGGEVVAPIFDRARDIAVAGAQVVPASARVVVVEGNYLLFDEAPWRELAPLWDLSARIAVPVEELRRRLVQRWLDHGLSHAAARARAEGNDIANAERVLARALPATLTLGTMGR